MVLISGFIPRWPINWTLFLSAYINLFLLIATKRSNWKNFYFNQPGAKRLTRQRWGCRKALVGFYPLLSGKKRIETFIKHILQKNRLASLVYAESNHKQNLPHLWKGSARKE